MASLLDTIHRERDLVRPSSARHCPAAGDGRLHDSPHREVNPAPRQGRVAAAAIKPGTLSSWAFVLCPAGWVGCLGLQTHRQIAVEHLRAELVTYQREHLIRTGRACLAGRGGQPRAEPVEES